MLSFRLLKECFLGSQKTLCNGLEVGKIKTINSAKTRPKSSMYLVDINHLFLMTLNRLFKVSMFDSNAKIIKLNNSSLFTNVMNDSLLYFADDEPTLYGINTVQESKISDEFRFNFDMLYMSNKRIKMLYIVVPNKLTVYSKFIDVSDNKKTIIWSRYYQKLSILENSGIRYLDLMPTFLENMKQEPDLYKPGDTHLSDRGYEVMGKRVEAELLDLLAN